MPDTQAQAKPPAPPKEAKEPRPPGRPRKEVCIRGHVNAGRHKVSYTCKQCALEDGRAWRAAVKKRKAQIISNLKETT